MSATRLVQFFRFRKSRPFQKSAPGGCRIAAFYYLLIIMHFCPVNSPTIGSATSQKKTSGHRNGLIRSTTLLISLDLPLGFIDEFGDFNPAGTGPGALEMVLAGPDPVGVVQFRQARLKSLVPAVLVEAGGLDYGGRPQKPGVFRRDGAGGKTGGAEDAVGGIIKGLAVPGRLNPFFFSHGFMIDQVRFPRLDQS